MDKEQRLNLITRDLQEIVGLDDLKTMINKDVTPIVYWGTAPTGRIHIGYFVQLLKLADYIKAGCNVTILIADLHAFLDNMKTSMKLLNARSEYYTIMIKEMLKMLGVDISNLKFVKGSDFQLTQKYTMDVYKLNSLTTLHDAKRAGAEVVKKSDNPTMTSLLYPTLQALDEEHLGAYIQAGGIDQRKIFMFAREHLPKIGYRKRIHLMTPILSGLRHVKQEETQAIVLTNEDKMRLLKLDPLIELPQAYIDTLFSTYVNDKEEFSNKMSASNPESKLDFLDKPFEIKKKINKAYCLPGDVEDNCLLEILNKVIFPILDYKDDPFVISRKEKFGGDITYANFDQILDDFKHEKLHPGDLKTSMIGTINRLFDPIREVFNTTDMKRLMKRAYP